MAEPEVPLKSRLKMSQYTLSTAMDGLPDGVLLEYNAQGLKQALTEYSGGRLMIFIAATISNQEGDHKVVLTTNDKPHSISIPPKSSGMGSSANGGELLFLALATCYCNDIYREAAKRNIVVLRVAVEVHGEFNPTPGSVAENLSYHATVEAEATEDDIVDLMRHTDTVAEIQNTIRLGTSCVLASMKAISV